jgi:hypothetical protein
VSEPAKNSSFFCRNEENNLEALTQVVNVLSLFFLTTVEEAK